MSGFEAAIEALVAGDEVTLTGLLREEPGLVRARSAREHGATLLHYCAANGVEQERQKTPPNIVALAELLLAAGADVNAPARIYGEGATTLRLAATSGHPERAGVQEALLDTLLEHGAAIRRGDVLACLWNGRERGAVFLSSRGAELGLAEAAGLGRLDLVQGVLSEGAAKDEMEQGFLLACEYGHNRVIEWLVAHGVDKGTRSRDGQTGLHMAAIGCRGDTVELLLRLGLPSEARNGYGATALEQARWSAERDREPERYAAVIERLAAAG